MGKFQKFGIFQYSAHVQIQNIVKMLKMQKKIFETNSHKSYEILQRIYIRHHMTCHEYYQYNTKRKIEVHRNKCKIIAYISAVISSLRVKLFLNKRIGFHYSFQNSNDYLPFKCLMVV